MLIDNVSNRNPLLDHARSKFLLASRTKVFDFCFFRAASQAEIVKEYVNFEVLWQDLPFIFSDVFRAQLHLPRMDVVTSLDETSVEHDTAERSAREALMSK
jgi:hypothetical protein